MEATTSIAEAAMDYAARGWLVIPVRGKAPVGQGWPDRATRDPGEAACLFEDTPHDGVGVLLGPHSGIIDLECDSPEAERDLLELFGGSVPNTPTFQSTRGRHRLFRWSDDMPESQRAKAKFNLGALEIRLGGGDRAAQTVFPPSGGRRWIVSPDDCEVAELPVSVLVKIASDVAGDKRQPRPEPQTTIHAPHSSEQLDVGRWLARRGVEVLRTDSTAELRRWFIRCPRIESHTTSDGVRDCVVTQDVTGKLGGHCFHASCGMGDWRALRDAIGRPEYQDWHPDEPPINEAACDAIARQGFGERTDVAAIESENDCRDIGDQDDVIAFPSDVLNVSGLLGEIICHTLATSLYPQPELALAGALALLGTVTGRKVTDRYGTRTNVYVLGLGLSGAGKEQARRVNKDLLLRSGAERMIGSERVGSHAGIVTTIHDAPACLMQLDEMGRLLETMKDPRKSPHLYNCVTVLMQLYSSSGTLWKADAYADAKKVKTIDQPHLCIYGTATPDSFWHSLSTDNIAEGLIGRLLVFEGRGYEIEMREPGESHPSKELIDALRWWNDFRPGGNLAGEHPDPKRVPHTPEAAERFQGHIRAINERRRGEHQLRAAVWSRSGEKVAKLALLHACSRSLCLPETVTLADVEWGVKLGNWLTRRLLVGCAEHVSENETEARAKRVLGTIPESGITMNSLTRKTQWLRGRERDEILRDLIGCGLVQTELVPSGARPATLLKRIKTKVR